MHRVLKPDGVAVVMFTHRSTAAWESLIQSLLSAGLYPTASWPVHTEFEGSTHQSGKGAVRSTILMACRKRSAGAGVGWYHQLQGELHRTIQQRLAQFWAMGLRGADFFISAIGPAVGVFGRYERVKRPDGREVSIGELLDEVRALASDFALEQLGRDLGRVDAPTRFYVLWRWAYGAEELEFDEANKLAKSLGVELDALANTFRLIRHRGEAVHLPDFQTRLQDEGMSRPIRRAVEEGRFRELPLIDALHLALLLWRRGEREGLVQLLSVGGFGEEDHPFWRVAQAVYEVEREAGSPAEEVGVLGQVLPAGSSLSHEAQRHTEATRQLRLF
jgi:adenine-specific DNA methylase